MDAVYLTRICINERKQNFILVNKEIISKTKHARKSNITVWLNIVRSGLLKRVHKSVYKGSTLSG